MKVFITGVGGLLGSNLANFLIGQGHEVGGIDNMIGGVDGNVSDGVDFTDGDITDTKLMKEITEGYEIIFPFPLQL